MKPDKKCKLCPNVAIRGSQYCNECKKEVLSHLREVGYLERGGYGHKGMTRTQDQKENTRETKYGRD